MKAPALCPKDGYSDDIELPSFDTSKNRIVFYVEGMRCHRCVQKIESASGSIPGLKSVIADLSRSCVEAEIEPGTSVSAVARQIAQLGFKARFVPGESRALQSQAAENRKWLMRLGVAAACTGNIMLFSVSVYAGVEGFLRSIFDTIAVVLFMPIVLFCAVPFYRTAFRQWPSVDLPIVAALWVGTGVSLWNWWSGSGDIYFDSLSMLVFLLLSSRYFLLRLQQKYLSLSYVQSFFVSESVERWDSCFGKYQKIHSSRLEPGDRIRLYRGQRVPADGKLLSEKAFLNTAVLTGEPLPEEFLFLQKIYAGFLLECDGAEMEVEASSHQSRLGELLREAERQVRSKTPLINFADRVGRWFVFIVLGISLVFFGYYWMIDSVEAVRRSLTLIILACPCTLAFAIPLTQSLALIRATKQGIIVKKAEALEKLNNIKTIFFDKTGTLTMGQMEVLGWETSSPLSDWDLQILAALEERSLHPIGRAIFKHLKDSGFDGSGIELEEVRVEGKGVSGKVNGCWVKVTTAPNQDTSAAADLSTRIGYFKEGELLAVIRLGDRIRPEAKRVVSQLLQNGFSIYILSGDAAGPAHHVGRELGIPTANIFSQLSPEDKSEIISRFPQALVVGDGANDALALASAHVSVAAHGSMEASLKVADIYLAQAGLEPLIDLLLISKNSFKVMKRNFAVSLVYNLIGGSAALTGIINPLGAAILMPLSSSSVVISALLGDRIGKVREVK